MLDIVDHYLIVRIPAEKHIDGAVFMKNGRRAIGILVLTLKAEYEFGVGHPDHFISAGRTYCLRPVRLLRT